MVSRACENPVKVFSEYRVNKELTPLQQFSLNRELLVDCRTGLIQARLCKIQGLFKDF